MTAPDSLDHGLPARPNLFRLNPHLHPVLAKAVCRMTELSRARRPQDLSAVLHNLENYRDQEIDFEMDLARLQNMPAGEMPNKRPVLLSTLQQRVFEISRRNRLLHFPGTIQTTNFTFGSVPLSFVVHK